MKTRGLLKPLIAMVIALWGTVVAAETINLAGEWTYRLDPENVGIDKQWYKQSLQGRLQLPGTLDQNKIGNPVAHKLEMSKAAVRELARYYDYTGAAWYQKRIKVPEHWQGKSIHVRFERVLWQSTLWVNDRYVDRRDSLSTPHRYELSGYLEPGRVNTLTLRVDNSYIHDISKVWGFYGAHAYTNGTQTIWNGIVGAMEITARDAVWVKTVAVHSDQAQRKLNVELMVVNELDSRVEADLALTVKSLSEATVVPAVRYREPLSRNGNHLSLELPLTEKVGLWDEFDPNVYRLHVSVKTGRGQSATRDEAVAGFGVRAFAAAGTQFTINGRRTFLRGTLECAIFPNTGYPPTGVEGWAKIFATAKEWGFNHIRFHSYTPPAAAFEAADRQGLYLQVELPLWKRNIGEKNTESRDQYLLEEAERIIAAYGNHPSFVLMSMGNELEGVDGDLSPMHRIVGHLQQRDDRHLYTTTSFSFTSGRTPEPVDQFFVTQYTDKGRGWVRGQRDYGEFRPGSTHNYGESLEGVNLPLISHEIGQYAVYPNLGEIPKYTGITRPVALETIRRDLKEKGLLDQADDFTRGSGHMAVYLYRAEVESALRTPGMAGFQFLSLSDFPGQSTATIGLLDAFWDSKGLIEAEAFRRFNAPTVPLLRTEKFVYSNDETFRGDITLSHFGRAELNNVSLSWTVVDEDAKVLFRGNTEKRDIPLGNAGESLGEVVFPLAGFSEPTRLNIEVASARRGIANDWDIWVYPRRASADLANASAGPTNILLTRVLDRKTLAALDKGRRVLLLPAEEYLKDDAVKGSFLPVFWSPVHFPTNAPMGILVSTDHPALARFPTGRFADWQWWELLNHSAAINLDLLPVTPTPIVQMIPNFFNNSMNAYIFEAKVSAGKLLVVSMDIENDLDKRPVARQLRRSVLDYMQSPAFEPAVELVKADVKALLLAQPRKTGLTAGERGPE